ncbi:MAG: lipoate protein ligase C-terminal domain-containing protein, partial [Bacteroidota bacterium]|nr:lipoate protein ligase C-terminal domain-containing protein [Bacteroidota bacterium]
SKFEDKAVQSNRSEVTNIAPYLPEPMSVEDFSNRLYAEISKQIGGTEFYSPNETDIEAIQKLSDEKYRTWDWIFGYSPRYRFNNTIQTVKGEIAVNLLVEKGLLAEVAITGAISETSGKKIAAVLLGCRHDLKAVETRLETLNNLLTSENIALIDFTRSFMQ